MGPDVDIVQYPEASISNQGTEAVMRFLAKGIFMYKWLFYLEYNIIIIIIYIHAWCVLTK